MESECLERRIITKKIRNLGVGDVQEIVFSIGPQREILIGLQVRGGTGMTFLNCLAAWVRKKQDSIPSSYARFSSSF